ILHGTRLTLVIGLVAVGIGGIVGSTLGLLSAMYRRIDPWVMRLNDMMLSFPAILLGLALVAVMGPGIWPVIIALAVASIPDCARIARSIGLGVMGQEYIEAGRAVGLSDFAIFRKYLLRNSISSILIFLSLRFGQVILIGAALSFLGLGARPPAAELGMMAAQGRDFLLFAPHIVAIPSAVIFIIVLCANVTGDALRDVLDPRLQPGRNTTAGKAFMKRYLLLGGLAAVLAAPALAQEINIVREMDSNNYDPHKSTARSAAEVLFMAGDTLVSLEPDMKTISDGLASSWEVSGDGLTYTFHLKEGITFCDGRAMTADDVVYSLTRWIDPETASPVAW